MDKFTEPHPQREGGCGFPGPLALGLTVRLVLLGLALTFHLGLALGAVGIALDVSLLFPPVVCWAVPNTKGEFQ